MDERWQEIKKLWKEHQSLYVLVGFLAGLLFEPFLQTVAVDIVGFLHSLVPEAVGIIFTVLLIDRLQDRREHRREESELKAKLIRELGSGVNAVAKLAAEELRVHGWLKDGSLRNAILVNADWRGMTLASADLAGVDLSSADLRKAALFNCNLEGAYLVGTDLENAVLLSKMQGANLSLARLINTTHPVDLQGYFDEKTTLPDTSTWTPDVDMGRFTDPKHPDFWDSKNKTFRRGMEELGDYSLG